MTLSHPFEQRDSWSSYGAVRAYSEVLYNLWGPRESDLSDSLHEEIHFSLKTVFMVDVRFELTTNDPWSAVDTICEVTERRHKSIPLQVCLFR